MNQQQQALEHFRSYAERWQRAAVNKEDEYNVIVARNAAVVATIDSIGDVRALLDVGCGTGQLVIAAAERGIRAHGIDFAPEMIAQCEANRSKARIDAAFECISFFELDVPASTYDLVSAQGFIEYISLDELEEFFRRVSRMLSSGGALVLGSRNRLFNCISMNRFTQIERDLGALNSLVSEAMIFQTSTSQEQIFAALRPLERRDPQPDAHPDTGIGVGVRYQFSPAELIGRLRHYAFRPVAIHPVHFHALPPSVKDEYPAVHNQIAKLMQAIAPGDARLVPFCSSFILDVRKAT